MGIFNFKKNASSPADELKRAGARNVDTVTEYNPNTIENPTHQENLALGTLSPDSSSAISSNVRQRSQSI